VISALVKAAHHAERLRLHRERTEKEGAKPPAAAKPEAEQSSEAG
jgi:hypothetical protein